MASCSLIVQLARTSPRPLRRLAQLQCAAIQLVGRVPAPGAGKTADRQDRYYGLPRAWLGLGKPQPPPGEYPLGDDALVIDATRAQERAHRLNRRQLVTFAPQKVLQSAGRQPGTPGESANRRVPRPDLYLPQACHEFPRGLRRHGQRRGTGREDDTARLAPGTEQLCPVSGGPRHAQAAGHPGRVFPAGPPVSGVSTAGLNVSPGDIPGWQRPARCGDRQGCRRKLGACGQMAERQAGLTAEQAELPGKVGYRTAGVDRSFRAPHLMAWPSRSKIAVTGRLRARHGPAARDGGHARPNCCAVLPGTGDHQSPVTAGHYGPPTLGR